METQKINGEKNNSYSNLIEIKRPRTIVTAAVVAASLLGVLRPSQKPAEARMNPIVAGIIQGTVQGLANGVNYDIARNEGYYGGNYYGGYCSQPAISPYPVGPQYGPGGYPVYQSYAPTYSQPLISPYPVGPQYGPGGYPAYQSYAPTYSQPLISPYPVGPQYGAGGYQTYVPPTPVYTPSTYVSPTPVYTPPTYVSQVYNPSTTTAPVYKGSTYTSEAYVRPAPVVRENVNYSNTNANTQNKDIREIAFKSQGNNVQNKKDTKEEYTVEKQTTTTVTEKTYTILPAGYKENCSTDKTYKILPAGYENQQKSGSIMSGRDSIAIEAVAVGLLAFGGLELLKKVVRNKKTSEDEI